MSAPLQRAERPERTGTTATPVWVTVAHVTVELLIDGAELVATLDADDREIAGGWIALDGGFVHSVGGSTDERPDATNVLRADGCLVTPGLINTHHHIYQNSPARIARRSTRRCSPG